MTDYGKLSVSNLTSIAELKTDDVHTIFGVAAEMKRNRSSFPKVLQDKRLAMLFEKESLRTRVTFEVGMQDLGGTAVFLDHQEVRLGTREALKDVAGNLSRWCHGIVARTFRHRTVQDLANGASIPVINGLTDYLHPCQGLTDMFTLAEIWGDTEGKKVAFVGDGNNTCHSLMHAATLLGCDVRIASPEGYEPNSKVVNYAMRLAGEMGTEITIIDDPRQAVEGVDCIYTDVWASMGREEETEERAEIFAEYRVTEELMGLANADAVFLHCLPAHRGMEVVTEVLDGPKSYVLENAENRLHVQKAVMALLMG